MEESVDKSRVLRQRSIDKEKVKAERKKFLSDNLRKILKKEVENRTKDDKEMLEQHKTLAKKINKNIASREEKEDRKKEWEDDLDVLRAKCAKLAEAIKRSKRLVVYTGAGISTSANIPDYRGPNGIWTLLDQGKEIAACDLGLAQPTTAHMALFMLYKQSKISHIVSQNCDGLHLRSGIPRCKISEVHGNMFIEVCKLCKPVRPYVRLFDVTERTNRHRHNTMRRCYICGASLQDTIVHFGERGSIAWPINWNGASKAAEKADMILCLGSSLKVLRRYPWLWCMDRPARQRPPLYIVNLQWTPKDATATMKINGRCDFVLAEVLKILKMKIPEYTPYNDPLLSFATHLHEKEEHTTSRRTLIESKPVGVTQLSMTADVSPNGVINEVRVKNKFTTVKSEFQHMSSERAESTDTETDGEEMHDRENEGENNFVNDFNDGYEKLLSNGNNNLDTNGVENSKIDVNDDTGDINESITTNNTQHHNGATDSNVSKPSPLIPNTCDSSVQEQIESDVSDTEAADADCIHAATNKKPKLESLNVCDNEGLVPIGDKNVLHSIMSQIEDYRPFPSPDHTYAISPIKEEIKEEKAVTEIKTEPPEDAEQSETPIYRSRLRQRKSPKYVQTEEDYFLMCQEELLNKIQKKHKKKLETQVKKEEDEDEEDILEPKEIEYRTINWPKDALYFSYEPNFLFNDEDDDDDIEFVCDCCDPKRKKKKPSSEECSEEEEASEKDLSEDDEDKNEDEIIDALDEDSDDSRDMTSREDSPAIDTPPTTPATSFPAKSSKPLPPGWFGKGRSKKRRK